MKPVSSRLLVSPDASRTARNSFAGRMRPAGRMFVSPDVERHHIPPQASILGAWLTLMASSLYAFVTTLDLMVSPRKSFCSACIVLRSSWPMAFVWTLVLSASSRKSTCSAARPRMPSCVVSLVSGCISSKLSIGHSVSAAYRHGVDKTQAAKSLKGFNRCRLRFWTPRLDKLKAKCAKRDFTNAGKITRYSSFGAKCCNAAFNCSRSGWLLFLKSYFGLAQKLRFVRSQSFAS